MGNAGRCSHFLALFLVFGFDAGANKLVNFLERFTEPHSLLVEPGFIACGLQKLPCDVWGQRHVLTPVYVDFLRSKYADSGGLVRIHSNIPAICAKESTVGALLEQSTPHNLRKAIFKHSLERPGSSGNQLAYGFSLGCKLHLVLSHHIASGHGAVGKIKGVSRDLPA